jgi:hypothetical protein
MKFLIALSVLASTTAFAQNMDGDRYIKCYGPAQQNEDAELVYKLKEKHGYLYVVHPIRQPLALNEQSGCLEYPSIHSDTSAQPSLTLCRGEGQRINGYIPVEAEYGQEEETVYCEKEIKKWFRNSPGL